MFEKNKLNKLASQIDATYNLYLSILNQRCTIVLSDVFEGKSTIIDIVLETLKISHPELNINSLKVNPSLLTVESKEFEPQQQLKLPNKSAVEASDNINKNKCLIKDNLSFLLEKLSLKNGPNYVNFILFDNSICPENFVDLLGIYGYIHNESTPYSFVDTNKIGSEDSHKLDATYIQTNSGRQYYIEKNTRPIIETTDISNLSPHILTRVGIVSITQALNLTNMIIIFNNKLLKFLEETSQFSDNVDLNDIVFEHMTTFLTKMIEKYSKEFQYQLNNFNIRSILLSFLNILKHLLKIPGENIFESYIVSNSSPNISKRKMLNKIDSKRSMLTLKNIDNKIKIERDQSSIFSESFSPEKNNITGYLSGTTKCKKEMTKSSLIEILKKSTIIAFFWSFGIILDSSARKKFNEIYIDYVSSLFEIDQDINFFEYYYDSKIQKIIKFIDSKHSSYFGSYNADYILENNNIYVSTLQTLQTIYQIDGHLVAKNTLNMAIIGNRFSGKSALLNYISSLVKSTHHLIKIYPILKQEQRHIYKIILQNFKYKENEKVYKTLSGRFPLIVVDDINIQPKLKGNTLLYILMLKVLLEINLLEFLRFWKISKVITDSINNTYYS